MIPPIGAFEMARSPSGLLKRTTGLVMVVVALVALVIVMWFIYTGHVVSLNGKGMLEYPLRTDFALYYRDSLVALRAPHHNPYDLNTFREVTASLGIKRLKADPVVPSLSLPPLIWLVMPFTLLPLIVARWLWMSLLTACLVMAWVVAAPAQGWRKWALLVMAAVFLPVSFAIADGQAILLVVGVVAVSWWLLKRGHEVWAGIALSLIVLKPQLAFAVPLVLLAAGRRRTFIAFGGASALIALTVLLTIPLDALLQYVARVTHAAHDPDLWRVNTNLTAATQGGPIVGLVEDAVAAAVAWIAVGRAKDQAVKDDLAFVSGLLISMLATPYLHYPDLSVLVLGAWIFLRLQPPAWQGWLLVAGYWLATMEPLGFPFTRTLELAWLLCLLQPPAPGRVVATLAAGIWQRRATPASRAA